MNKEEETSAEPSVDGADAMGGEDELVTNAMGGEDERVTNAMGAEDERVTNAMGAEDGVEP